MGTKLFKQEVVHIGDIAPGQKNVVVDFFYDSLKAEDIAVYPDGRGGMIPAVTFGCGCTASPQILPDRLRVYYNDGGNNLGTISKGLRVMYKKEGAPVRVRNERGVEVFNPELASTSLTFTANVVKK